MKRRVWTLQSFSYEFQPLNNEFIEQPYNVDQNSTKDQVEFTMNQISQEKEFYKSSTSENDFLSILFY